jgi:hypothetical protein
VDDVGSGAAGSRLALECGDERGGEVLRDGALISGDRGQ